ncbi:MAG: SDR family NAD(P)-dependent oxidoreductase, partial [Planctomycetota bacterium]
MDETQQTKTLLLTGASRGIGHATVKRFSAAGWRVLTCSRHAFDPRCPWPGGEENHIQIDLADPHKTIEALEVIRSKLGGRLEALVNNAGISPKGEDGARLDTLNTDLRIWGHVFHVNFFAPVVLARGL